MNSHAVIVSRELGIPCVVSALDAIKRMPDGAQIEIDGGHGDAALARPALETARVILHGLGSVSVLPIM